VTTDYLVKTYHPGSGLIASAVAMYSAYLLIEIVKRVRTAEREMAIGWVVAGAMCVGTGVWANSFVGLLSLHLPIEVGFDTLLTFLSWLPGVVSMGIVVALLGRPHLALQWRICGAGLLALGMSATNLVGLESMRLHTGIDWRWDIATVAGLLSLIGMAGGSVMIRHVLDSGQPMTLPRALLAALPCALALRAAQYATIESAQIPLDAQSLAHGQLNGDAVAGLVTMATGLLFALVHMAIVLDERMKLRHEQLARTLRNAHLALADSAHRDTLTRLLNRRGFERHLTELLQHRGDPRLDVLILFVNLDGFKLVNESLGHSQGDVLLQQAARRLTDLVRREDVVAHVSADEFVMLFQGPLDKGLAGSLALRVKESLERPFTLGRHEIALSCSIGVAMATPEDQAPELISHAETAMRNAKAAGGGLHCFYEAGMTSASSDQLDLQRDLRLAIERQELMLFYQPKLQAGSGSCKGVEALLRWKHGTRGMISPGEFIPLAERFGLIGLLGAWVVEEACRQIRDWGQSGLHLQVAVNLSVHQLRQPDLAERIQAAIERHGIAPASLIFEITESVAMENVQASLKVFEQLAAIGVELSIDDFGTGYSSLSYLSKLPARQLKIDRSFVKDLGQSPNAHAIVEAVLRLAHALRLKVVAEGVETETQHQILLSLGCDELQGFLFARPMPAHDLLAWLAERQPANIEVDDVERPTSDSGLAELH